MSNMFQPPLDRRRFLQSSLAVAAGVVTLGPQRLFGDDRRQGTRWALLSDTHIADDPDNRHRRFYPYQNLKEIASQIAGDLPEGVVITGDLARLKGRVGAYENVKAILSPIIERRPVYLGLGNHDRRDDFFHTFGSCAASTQAVEDRQIVTAEVGAVRLVVLDTLLHVNRIPGLLGRPQRTWLETFLHVCDDRPTILFLHHTPRTDLLDTTRLFDIIAPLAKVKAVVHGHSHKLKFSQFKGIHVIGLPATGYNFKKNQPVGWMAATLTGTGGQFTMHAIGGDRESDGHTETLVWRT